MLKGKDNAFYVLKKFSIKLSHKGFKYDLSKWKLTLNCNGGD